MPVSGANPLALIASLQNGANLVNYYDKDAINDMQSAQDEAILGAVGTALNQKSNTGHGHQINDVSGLQNALNQKSNTGHGHQINDVSGLQAALDTKLANGGKAADSDKLGGVGPSKYVRTNSIQALAASSPLRFRQDTGYLSIYKGAGSVSSSVNLNPIINEMLGGQISGFGIGAVRRMAFHNYLDIPVDVYQGDEVLAAMGSPTAMVVLYTNDASGGYMEIPEGKWMCLEKLSANPDSNSGYAMWMRVE